MVQGLVGVPFETATPNPSGAFNFQLQGEVLADDRLFDHFRYRYDLPKDETDRLALLFQRRLRPGTYTLLLRLEDLNSGRYFRSETELFVPFVAELAPSRPSTRTAEIDRRLA